MSQGSACRCVDKEKSKNWVVTQRRCNHSAFNGYRRTPSEYSAVVCQKCQMGWRTKAEYVDRLPDRK